MIFERRAYTLRPGWLEAFWEAQENWNVPAVFGPILKRNIGYFSAVTGSSEEVVHLYRFDSLDQWDALYKAYYKAQSPDYFALVRAWMLRQENSFLAPPSIASLAARWTGARLLAPPGLDAVSPEAACIVETTILLFPGAMPVYWQACEAHRLVPEPLDDRNLLAELVSLIGRLHSVARYEAFRDPAEALQRMAERNEDPRWRGFERAYADWVADRTVTVLRLTPLATRRALLGGAAG